MQANKLSINWFLGKDTNKLVLFMTDDSPARLYHLNRSGIYPLIMPSSFPAEKLFDVGLSTNIAVKTAAEESAREVAEKLKKSNKKYDIVMGLYTVAVMNDKVFAKPSTREEAFQTLKLLSGGTHSVVTGVMLLHVSEKFETFVVETKVKFYDIPDEMLQQYVDSDFWKQTFAGYGIFHPSAAFIESFNGNFYNVMGAPIPQIIQGIRKLMLENEKSPSPVTANKESAVLLETNLNATIRDTFTVAKEESTGPTQGQGMAAREEGSTSTKQQGNVATPVTEFQRAAPSDANLNNQISSARNDGSTVYSNRGNYGTGPTRGFPSIRGIPSSNPYVQSIVPSHPPTTGFQGASSSGYQNNGIPQSQNSESIGVPNRDNYGNSAASTRGFPSNRGTANTNFYVQSSMQSNSDSTGFQRATSSDANLDNNATRNDGSTGFSIRGNHANGTAPTRGFFSNRGIPNSNPYVQSTLQTHSPSTGFQRATSSDANLNNNATRNDGSTGFSIRGNYGTGTAPTRGFSSNRGIPSSNPYVQSTLQTHSPSNGFQGASTSAGGYQNNGIPPSQSSELTGISNRDDYGTRAAPTRGFPSNRGGFQGASTSSGYQNNEFPPTQNIGTNGLSDYGNDAAPTREFPSNRGTPNTNSYVRPTVPSHPPQTGFQGASTSSGYQNNGFPSTQNGGSTGISDHGNYGNGAATTREFQMPSFAPPRAPFIVPPTPFFDDEDEGIQTAPTRFQFVEHPRSNRESARGNRGRGRGGPRGSRGFAPRIFP